MKFSMTIRCEAQQKQSKRLRQVQKLECPVCNHSLDTHSHISLSEGNIKRNKKGIFKILFERFVNSKEGKVCITTKEGEMSITDVETINLFL